MAFATRSIYHEHKDAKEEMVKEDHIDREMKV
jgi:hypothetical protein